MGWIRDSRLHRAFNNGKVRQNQRAQLGNRVLVVCHLYCVCTPPENKPVVSGLQRGLQSGKKNSCTCWPMYEGRDLYRLYMALRLKNFLEKTPCDVALMNEPCPSASAFSYVVPGECYVGLLLPRVTWGTWDSRQVMRTTRPEVRV